MSKQSRHPLDFYGSLLSDDRDHSFKLKYGPQTKPIVMGFYKS